jgi:adenosylcobinamide-GDP ribazoletransferase
MFPTRFFQTTYTDPIGLPPSPLLPLAGLVTGLVGLGAYWLGTVLFPPPYLPVLLSMATVAGLTQARPESGFTRFAGGGLSASSVPHTQSAGVVWLGLLIVARLFTLQALFANEAFGPVVALKFIMAHSLSHLMAGSVSWSLPQQPDFYGLSATTAIPSSLGTRVVTTLLGLLPMVILIGLTTLWIYGLFLVPLVLLRGWLVGWFRRKTGGYTGVTLGTVQQLSELLIYLSFVSLLWVSV